MKFRFIKQVDKPVNSYTGAPVMTGDIVELDEHFSSKALKNPNYERVKPGPKPKKQGAEPLI